MALTDILHSQHQPPTKLRKLLAHGVDSGARRKAAKAAGVADGVPLALGVARECYSKHEPN